MIEFLIFLCFTIRAIPRVIRKNALVSDTYFHLFCADIIRKNHFHIPRILPKIVLNHEYSYPYLYHWVLSLFSHQKRAWSERFTGAFFDTINVILLFGFAGWLTLYSSQNVMGNIPLWIAALIVFSPALLRLGSGPRAYNGSPRIFGQTLYLVHLISFVVWYQTQSPLLLCASIIAGAALLVTAKFGTQVFFFFGVFFGILYTPIYFLFIISSLIFALILTAGRAGTVLRGSILHSIFYYRYMQVPFLEPHQRSIRSYLLNSAGPNFWTTLLRKREIGPFLTWYFTETHPLHVFITVFPQFILLPVWLINYSHMSSQSQFLVIWATAGFFLFIATKTKKLLFLGEGERYLEYSLFPSLWLSILWCITNSYTILLVIFLFYSIVATIWYINRYVHQFHDVDEDFVTVGDAFKELGETYPSGVIMPIASFHWQTVFWSQFPVLTIGGNVDERLLSSEEFQLVYGNYPYPSGNFQQIIEKYHVAYIVSDEVHIAQYVQDFLTDKEFFETHVTPLIQTSTLTIFKVTKS